MSDTASDLRRPQAAPPPGDMGEARADGSSASGRKPPRPETDQQTIITNRQPIPSPSVSDSTNRILEGHVMPGDRLGHFELVEFVGGGGMGRVFRAIDTQLGRTVALKVLPPEQATDADSLQRFQNEAQSSARLDHDNIARAYYVGEDRGLHYIVFEFIEGVNVRLLVEQKGPLPLAEAVSYTLQVAEALAHADARAVVHRDIKPSNVLITPEGRVKLIDMGLARLRLADPAAADLTASGVTLGTFDYISPEQARDPRNADIRSDIYSLGCTLFFMLSGQPPFPQGTVLQKLLQHQGDQPPDIQQFRPELPPESSRVLRKMMAKDPRHRYAGPAELVADLLLLADQIGLRPMSPASRIWLVPQEPSVSLLHRHLPWIAPVAALFCIVMLLDRYWSFSARRDDQLPPSADVVEPSLPPPPASRVAKKPAPPAALREVQADAGRTIEPRESKVRSQRRTDAGKPANKQPGTLSAAYTDDVGLSSPNKDGDSRIDRGVTGRSAAATRGELSADAAKSSSDRASSADLTASSTGGTSRPAASVGEPSGSAQAARHPAVLIVSAAPKGDNQFSTLAAACAAAHNGDIVELRFNGPREELPVKISNLRLTIRAGEGHEPVVVFRPTDVDPVKYPHAMFTLAGGQLTISGVAAELHVPRDVPADNWSLLETLGGEMVRLEHCSLTVLNASDQGSRYHQDAAFFRVRAAANADVAGVAPAATPLATLELTDCIARGEADFLRVEDLQPVHLMWDNGLLIAERLLVASGGQTAPKLDEVLRIELRRVTASVRGGLCRLTSTFSNPHQLPVQFVSTNNILMSSPGVPLVEQEGAGGLESFRQRLLWNGDRNFYQDVDVFWTVRGLDLELPPDEMDFDAWRAYWGPSRENQPSTERLLWRKVSEGDRPLHVQGPADYTLADPTFGDSSAGAPGCGVDRLPPLPLEPSARRRSAWGGLPGAAVSR
jgi:eukaryotic-like serine/threonine-protein kinase